ncbi:MAG: hypothetical protein Q4G68_03805 [Planctomycetia bacterium]|nr:hypothetical protein [Planctomycetia bacterium]
MPKNQHPQYTLFSQIDVSTSVKAGVPASEPEDADMKELMRMMLAAQNRQNELLEEMVEQLGAVQRQRALDLAAWKQANPYLSKACRMAADKLSKVQATFLNSLADEIEDNFDNILESDYYCNEFLDRFGPRFMHLNVLLQALSQLGSAPDTTKTVPW